MLRASFPILWTALVASGAAAAAPSLQRVGLAPDVAATTAAEALTASARGGTALMYNPAGLARPVWGLKLVEYYQSVDQSAIDVSKRVQRSTQGAGPPDLNEVWGLVRGGDRLSFEFGATALEATAPFAAARGFAYGRADVEKRRNAAGEDVFAFNLESNVGAAAGFAIHYGRWSLGVARYYLVRTELSMTPSADQVHSYADRAARGDLAPGDVPFQDFTKFAAGNGLGTNAGLLWQPWEDNPTGLGVAVLNAGGTKFRREPLVHGERADKADRAVQKFADQYALTVDNPAPLRQITNAGATLGYGGATSDFFLAAVSVDYHDLGGDTVAFKGAGSAELEAWLPEAVASALSVNYKPEKSKTTYRAGLYGGHVVAGVQEGEYTSYAFGLIFHAGVEKISPLRLTIDHTVLEGIGQNAGHRRQGIAASLALTFVL